MSHYEVTVHARGVKNRITSPATYTYEDAQAQLERIREGQKERQPVQLDWLSVDGSAVIAAHIEQVVLPRTTTPRSSDEIFAALETKLLPHPKNGG